MLTLRLFAFMAMTLGILKLLDIRLEDLFKSVIDRPKSIRDQVNEATNKKKKNFIKREIEEITNILKMTGREEKIPVIFIACGGFAIAGTVIASLFNNVYMIPPLAVGMMFVPVWYVKLTASHFKKDVSEELETALSIITTAYIRNEDTMRKLYSMKTQEQIAETEKSLSEFPDKVTVYRGEGDRSSGWENSKSWTTDINVANFFATRMVGDSAKILVAEVEKKDIIEYFEYENECVILPENIKIKNEINLKGKKYLEKTLPEIAEWYSEYKGLITEEVEFNSENEHGKEHAARVLLNCLLMAYERKLSMHEVDILAIAAVFHDAMRTNDGEDPKHGENCAEYYKEFAKNSYMVDEEKVIAQIIKYHCLPDEIGKAEIEKRYHKLFDIFKDADALDRVRFGIRGLDVNQLRTSEARTMTMVAVASFEGLKIHEIESYYDLDSDVNDDVIDTMNLI